MALKDTQKKREKMSNDDAEGEILTSIIATVNLPQTTTDLQQQRVEREQGDTEEKNLDTT